LHCTIPFRRPISPSPPASPKPSASLSTYNVLQRASESANATCPVSKFTHPAGIGIEAAFCDRCGTWLYKRVEAEPFKRWYLVQAGTTGTGAEAGPEVKVLWTEAPKIELWVSQRAPWLGAVEGAEQKVEF
jgi:hypothetical protein